MEKYEKNGYNLVALSGKKMKMNYIQSQRIDRAKCESNMIFLGFVALKVNYDGYNSAFSWWDILRAKFINNVNNINNIYYIFKCHLSKTINNYFFLKFNIYLFK